MDWILLNKVHQDWISILMFSNLFVSSSICIFCERFEIVSLLLTSSNSSFIVSRRSDDRFWFSIADSDVVLWAKGVALGKNLNVKVFEPDVSPLAIQGPKSKQLMSDLYGEEVVELSSVLSVAKC